MDLHEWSQRIEIAKRALASRAVALFERDSAGYAANQQVWSTLWMLLKPIVIDALHRSPRSSTPRRERGNIPVVVQWIATEIERARYIGMPTPLDHEDFDREADEDILNHRVASYVAARCRQAATRHRNTVAFNRLASTLNRTATSRTGKRGAEPLDSAMLAEHCLTDAMINLLLIMHNARAFEIAALLKNEASQHIDNPSQDQQQPHAAAGLNRLRQIPIVTDGGPLDAHPWTNIDAIYYWLSAVRDRDSSASDWMERTIGRRTWLVHVERLTVCEQSQVLLGLETAPPESFSARCTTLGAAKLQQGIHWMLSNLELDARTVDEIEERRIMGYESILETDRTTGGVTSLIDSTFPSDADHPSFVSRSRQVSSFGPSSTDTSDNSERIAL